MPHKKVRWPAWNIKPQASKSAACAQMSLATLSDCLFCSGAKPQSRTKVFHTDDGAMRPLLPGEQTKRLAGADDPQVRIRTGANPEERLPPAKPQTTFPVPSLLLPLMLSRLASFAKEYKSPVQVYHLEIQHSLQVKHKQSYLTSPGSVIIHD